MNLQQSANYGRFTWRNFAAAPHRPMFAAGAVHACLGMAWWFTEILDRFAEWITLPEIQVSPDWAHGYLMVYGFFPFFMFGFLMTAMPSWVNRDKPEPDSYLPCAALMFVGVTMFYPGLYWSEVFLYLGLLLQLIGWIVGLTSLAHLLNNGHDQDLRHPLVAVAGMAVGALGLLLFDFSLVVHSPAVAEMVMWGGVWLFLMPVFLVVAHRMIPYFSSRVIENYQVVRPYWALWVLVGASVGHGMLMIVDLGQFTWLVDVAGFAVSLYLVIAWRSDRVLENRLLAVLHIAFLWVPVAFALGAWQSFENYQYIGAGAPPIHRLMPLHALTIGFFSSMLIGMASRVSLGHSGRPLVADTPTWVLFLAMNAAALGRLTAELPWAVSVSGDLLALSSAVWLAAFASWAVKYLPMFLAPRADGKPG